MLTNAERTSTCTAPLTDELASAQVEMSVLYEVIASFESLKAGLFKPWLKKRVADAEKRLLRLEALSVRELMETAHAKKSLDRGAVNDAAAAERRDLEESHDGQATKRSRSDGKHPRSVRLEQ